MIGKRVCLLIRSYILEVAMLGTFTKFLNSLVNAVPALYEKYKEDQHDTKIVELFESYFILGNLLETADQLLTLARGREIIEFAQFSEEELEEEYDIIQSKITIQLQRIERLGEIFLRNPTIDLLDSTIKRDLKLSIGDKRNGLFTLGAGLFFNQIFGIGSKRPESETQRESIEKAVNEKYQFISALTEPEKILVKEQRIIVSDFEALRKRYQEILFEITDPKHKILLASKAKEFADEYSLRK